MGISISEYARRQGVSRQAVHKRISKGKIKPLADGTIDEAQANAEWSENRDELQTQRGTKSAAKRDAAAKRSDGMTFSDLQRAEKALKVQRDQIKLRREQGKLIEVEEARRAWADMISNARGALLPIGGELADRLAAEPDPVQVREQIDRRIYQALAHLADYQPVAHEE